jgi:hypothetical protein
MPGNTFFSDVNKNLRFLVSEIICIVSSGRKICRPPDAHVERGIA